MKKNNDLNETIENNIICNKCLNIPLLGIDFSYNSENNFIDTKIYSFCLFKHDKNVKEVSLNNIFENKNEKIKNICEISDIKCEYCRKSSIFHLCIECKRNLCNKCKKYHKSHKTYDNDKLLTKNELNQIDDNFNKSKNIMNRNLILINNYINKYKSQLKKLEKIYDNYKDVNIKLISL